MKEAKKESFKINNITYVFKPVKKEKPYWPNLESATGNPFKDFQKKLIFIINGEPKVEIKSFKLYKK